MSTTTSETPVSNGGVVATAQPSAQSSAQSILLEKLQDELSQFYFDDIAADLADMALDTLVDDPARATLPAKPTRTDIELAFADWRAELAWHFGRELSQLDESIAGVIERVFLDHEASDQYLAGVIGALGLVLTDKGYINREMLRDYNALIEKYNDLRRTASEFAEEVQRARRLCQPSASECQPAAAGESAAKEPTRKRRKTGKPLNGGRRADKGKQKHRSASASL
jgi:hypothetical protein